MKIVPEPEKDTEPCQYDFGLGSKNKEFQKMAMKASGY